MGEVTEKIYCCDRGDNDNTLAAAILAGNNRRDDWGPMAAMMGGGMNNWMNNPGKVTTDDVTYAANMAYADFYPDPLKDEAACLRYAHKVANDPDGYDGMIFCRWTADAIGKSNQVGLGKIRIVC